MIIDEDIARLRAAKEGLPADFIVKDSMLMELLRMMSASGILERMIFKGGTALNKIYFKEDFRFSEDLDFDFSGNDWNSDYKWLIAEKAGFYSLEARQILKGKVFQIDYMYRTGKDKKDRIRLDINISANIKTVEKIKSLEVVSTFVDTVVSNVRVYGFEDLLARKIGALRNRTEGKDIFDASFGIRMANASRLVSAISCMLSTSSKPESAYEFLNETIEKVRAVDYKKARNLTNQYIPIKSRPSDWKIMIDSLVDNLIKLEKHAKNHQ